MGKLFVEAYVIVVYKQDNNYTIYKVSEGKIRCLDLELYEIYFIKLTVIIFYTIY